MLPSCSRQHQTGTVIPHDPAEIDLRSALAQFVVHQWLHGLNLPSQITVLVLGESSSAFEHITPVTPWRVALRTDRA